MRVVVLAFALSALATPALAAPKPAAKPAVGNPAAVDWTKRIEATPQGGVRIGNPAAKVQLLEFGSFTCSHCKVFHDEGLPALKAKYIATGNLAFEFRSFSRNGADFAATLLAACQVPARQLSFMDALFTEQEKWVQPFTVITDADSKRIGALPVEQQFGPLAKAGKLDAWATAHGLAPKKAADCLASKPAMDMLVTNRNQAVNDFGLTGTPTFVMNGKTVADVYEWKTLEPKLEDALR